MRHRPTPFARRLRGLRALLAAAWIAPALGCVHHHHRPGPPLPPPARAEPGPPPWAPAHGYRHKHAHGTELVYDARLGVYVVIGLDHHYFHGTRYYRRAGTRWEISDGLRGPWAGIEVEALPAGLRPGRAKAGRKGRRGPPAKHPR